MLGSVSEADDAVQEAWLKLSRSDASGIENLGGWLTTVVARVCLDMLRSRTSRREESLGEGLSELVANSERTDPEHEVLLADSVGLALLVVLDRLTPAERLAFVLHDMFAVSFEEIATIVPFSDRGKTAGQPRTPPSARRGDGCQSRSHPTTTNRRCFPHGLTRPRLRGLGRAARPRCRGSSGRSRGASRSTERDPGCTELGQGSDRLLTPCPFCATDAGRRRCGTRVGSAWTAVEGAAFHDHAREDCGGRRDRRPSAPK